MKIALICPANSYGRSATAGIYYPMGILVVGRAIHAHFPKWDVSVIDGEQHSMEDQVQYAKGCDYLGLSANTSNYQNCLLLAGRAKYAGQVKRVIIGGPHPSALQHVSGKCDALAKMILANRDVFDAAALFEGSQACLRYIIECERANPMFDNIHNLAYRDVQGKVIINQTESPQAIPLIAPEGYSQFPLEKYWQAHKEEFPGMAEKFIQAFSHIGCRWRERRGCSFCGIPYPTNIYQEPAIFWSNIQQLSDLLCIRSVKDYGDSITARPASLEALLRARPSSLRHIEFSAYARSAELSEVSIRLLENLNVRYLYIGFDSGSDEMLASMRHGNSARANYLALEKLERTEIRITASLILGAAGENEKTVSATGAFAGRLLRSSNIAQMHCAVMSVFPGTYDASRLLSRVPCLYDDDVWDTKTVQELWTTHFCSAPLEFLYDKARVINAQNPSRRKRYLGFDE